MKRLGVVAIFAVMMGLLYWRSPSEQPEPVVTEAAEIPAQPPSQFHEGSEAVTNSDTPRSAIRLSSTTKDLLLSCVKGSETFSGIHSPADFQTLDEFFTRAQRSHGGEKPTVELAFQNLHALTSNEEEIRLHVAALSGGETPSRMVPQFFKADEDGLPVPVDLPQDYETLTAEEALVRFHQQFPKLILDEKSETWRWPSGASANLKLRNGQLEEIQLFLETKSSLACGVAQERQIDCQCLE